MNILPSDNTIAPQLTDVIYSNDASGVLLNSLSKLIFNTPINAINGDIVMTNGRGDTRIISINDSTQITMNANVIIINPKDDFIPNSHYTFTIAAGVIADGIGNAFTGINSHNPVSFATQDVMPPKLISAANQNNNSIVLMFDKTVQLGTGNILLSNGVDNRKLAITDAQVKIDGNKITISPTTVLETGTNYNVQLDNNTVSDVVGNRFVTNAKGIDFAFENMSSVLLHAQPPKLMNINS